MGHGCGKLWYLESEKIADTCYCFYFRCWVWKNYFRMVNDNNTMTEFYRKILTAWMICNWKICELLIFAMLGCTIWGVKNGCLQYCFQFFWNIVAKIMFLFCIKYRFALLISWSFSAMMLQIFHVGIWIISRLIL